MPEPVPTPPHISADPAQWSAVTVEPTPGWEAAGREYAAAATVRCQRCEAMEAALGQQSATIRELAEQLADQKAATLDVARHLADAKDVLQRAAERRPDIQLGPPHMIGCQCELCHQWAAAQTIGVLPDVADQDGEPTE